MAGEVLADDRTGKNGRHALVGMFRQSVFGRLAGYEDVNDAERLRHDPAMRWIVGGKAANRSAASPSQMCRFEAKWLAAEKNLSALADLSRFFPRRAIILGFEDHAQAASVDWKWLAKKAFKGVGPKFASPVSSQRQSMHVVAGGDRRGTPSRSMPPRMARRSNLGRRSNKSDGNLFPALENSLRRPFAEIRPKPERFVERILIALRRDSPNGQVATRQPTGALVIKSDESRSCVSRNSIVAANV
jgi:hypothetical protein